MHDDLSLIPTTTAVPQQTMKTGSTANNKTKPLWVLDATSRKNTDLLAQKEQNTILSTCQGPKLLSQPVILDIRPIQYHIFHYENNQLSHPSLAPTSFQVSYNSLHPLNNRYILMQLRPAVHLGLLRVVLLPEALKRNKTYIPW